MAHRTIRTIIEFELIEFEGDKGVARVALLLPALALSDLSERIEQQNAETIPAEKSQSDSLPKRLMSGRDENHIELPIERGADAARGSAVRPIIIPGRREDRKRIVTLIPRPPHRADTLTKSGSALGRSTDPRSIVHQLSISTRTYKCIIAW